MIKYLILVIAVTAVNCQARKRIEDPFAAFDKHLTHTLTYHYLWPWSKLIQAAAALDAEENLEEPQIISNPDKFEVHLNVKRFTPDELKIKVKNKYILVEGKHKETDEGLRFAANHFVQRFVLPPGSKPEEVTAVFNENGILNISAPKHELPPPPPERIVPIEVKMKIEDQTENEEITTEKKEVITSSATPLEQLDLVEATTHVGKIRKKDLKTTTKTSKDNEVTKGVDGNGLDYVLVE
ncbi:hypothetical protein K1T71_001593 [Dendrolimus kikuchii]|uniref:Uncharacterized protein n=1 Tax=Dendrolimus kikuchii TaxID=765133 RepID=A0ACC1DE34_9NEOP|nr:hypothetical protein K1T71_001593 [Dendrolimus kikuchii]